jgi:hypothetical protein
MEGLKTCVVAVLVTASLAVAAWGKVRYGRINVNLSGAVQQLTSDTNIYGRKVTIQARPGNAGVVYVGLSDLAGADTAMAVLSAGVGVTFNVSNANDDDRKTIQLADLYVLGTANDDVHVFYELP